MFSNPAELPVAGIGFFRWLFADGAVFRLLFDRSAQRLKGADEIILALRDNPINYGFSPLSFSLFTSNLGVSVFAELVLTLNLTILPTTEDYWHRLRCWWCRWRGRFASFESNKVV